MAHKATAKGVTPKAVEVAYYSASLKAFEKHIDDAHWRYFDGDPITGSQEPDGLTVVGVSRTGNVVSASYSADSGVHLYKVGYVMIEEEDAWKVNNIIYAPVGRFKSPFENL